MGVPTDGAHIGSSITLNTDLPLLNNSHYATAADRKVVGQLRHTSWPYMDADTGKRWKLRPVTQCFVNGDMQALQNGTWGTDDSHWEEEMSAAAVQALIAAALGAATGLDFSQVTFSTDANQTFAYNVLDTRTGNLVGFKRVSTWFDGTAMSSAKCDGITYKELKPGQYYRMGGPSGTGNFFDLGLYLVGDGTTDNLPRWNALLTYLRQAYQHNRAPVIRLLIPEGVYYSAGMVNFGGLNGTLENYGKHTFPGGTMGWLLPNNDNCTLEITGIGAWLAGPRVPAVGDDGQVANNDASYLAYLSFYNIRLDKPAFGFPTYQAYMSSKPAGSLVQSLRPSDYKFHGLVTTMVSRVKIYRIEFFSGIGAYGYAPAIQQSDPLLAPSRYNTSYAIFEGNTIANCGFALVGEGADANHMGVQWLDLRESMVANFVDLTQSGIQCVRVAEELGGIGGFWSLCYGITSGVGYYSETDTTGNTYNLFNSGEHHGIFNKVNYGTGWVQGGSHVSGGSFGTLLAGQFRLTQGGAQYLQSSNALNGNGLAVRTSLIGPGATHYGMHDVVMPGEGTADGRQYALPTVAQAVPDTRAASPSKKGHARLGRLAVKVQGLQPTPNQYWQPGDLLENEPGYWNLHGPNQWLCQTRGLAPGSTYASAGGPTGVWAGTQRIVLAYATSLLGYDDDVLINGQRIRIVALVYVGPIEARFISEFSVAAPFDTSQPPTIEVAYQATFKAVENGAAGTTAQRPSLQAADVGYGYFDTDLGRKVYWNGSTFV